MKMAFVDASAPKISFIVPVFNAEKYLRDCLDSIVFQLSGNELILVDDGSTDSSGCICDEYASRYPRITVMHTENHGASFARNLGLDTAQGRYIVFVDSDDYINTDFAVSFSQADITADIVFFPMRKLLKNGQYIAMGDGISSDVLRHEKKEDVLNHIASCPKFPASPCGKIVFRDFLKEYHIHFAFDRTSEDYDWTYQLLQHSRSFAFWEGGLYTYRQIPQSRSSIGSSRSVEDQLAILTSWEKRAVPESFRQPLNSFLAYEYAMILPFYGALSKLEQSIFRHEIHRCSYLLRYGKSKKLRLIRFFCLLFGTERTAQLLFIYIHLRNKRYGK